MIVDFWHRMDDWARASTPAMVTVMVVILGVVPLHIPFYGPVAPSLAIAALYYWAAHRPDLMPYTVVFAIGLVQDVLAGTPLGVHAFMFLMVQWMVIGQRRQIVGKPFAILWLGYIMVAVAAEAMGWAATGLVRGAVLPIEPVAFSTLISAAFFPVPAWLMIQVHRGFLS